MKKLDVRGIAHDVVIVAFVAVFAIAGVAYLVASHADTCTPVSGPVINSFAATPSISKPSCAPVSSPVSSSTDTQPPSAPTNLRINSITGNSVDLSWAPSSDNVGVSYYNVLRAASNQTYATVGRVAGAVSSTSSAYSLSYTDSNVLPANSYAYKIEAVDAAGNLSSFSNIVTAKIPSGQVAAICSISNVPGQSTQALQLISPDLTIVNTGNLLMKPQFQEYDIIYNLKTQAQIRYSQTRTGSILKPGESERLGLQQSAVPYASSSNIAGVYRITGVTPKFSCTAFFKLPAKP